MIERLLLVLLGVLVATNSAELRAQAPAPNPGREFDVVVYGGTSAAVTAAVQVKRMGKSVAIVCPDKHLGGLSSGGLGWTDSGKKEVIGGLAREFYHRIFLEYEKPSAWKWQERSDYGNKGQGNQAIDGKNRTQWIFEPHIAERVFENLVAEHSIPCFETNGWTVKMASQKAKDVFMRSQCSAEKPSAVACFWTRLTKAI